MIFKKKTFGCYKLTEYPGQQAECFFIEEVDLLIDVQTSLLAAKIK
jgi:hypothetical protein